MKKKYKIKYYAIVVVDSFGHSDYAVVIDLCDDVMICGLKDKNGREIDFESEAYHLKSWAKEEELIYKIEELTVFLEF